MFKFNLGSTVMERWMEKHEELWQLEPRRFLYIHNCTEDLMVIETNNNKVFIYEYDCGHLCNIRSENNTFAKYFMMVMVAEDAEYHDRTDR